MRRWTAVIAAAVLTLVSTGMAASSARAEDGPRTATTDVARADWSAGAVSRGTGYWRPNGSHRVRELQRRLTRAGLHPGPVDGLYGPRTERAVRRFQQRRHLQVDAIAGRRTLRALRRTDAPNRAQRPRATAPPAAVPQALPAPQAAPQAAPEPAPTPAGLPLTALFTTLGLVGLAIVAASYWRTRRAVLRSHRRPGPRPHTHGSGEPAG
jgi:peptidoglycan hydrolase-like protein with peptidoglycan-binding domain